MTPEEEEAQDRLLFHLENQSGFWFALIVGDDARPRERICEVAEAWCKEHGLAFTLHEPEPDGLVSLAVKLAAGGDPGVHWIRADGVKGILEQWDAGAAQMLMAMNERREAYRKRLDGGIMVEGRPSLKRILREMAPDLFSIRAFIAEPGEELKARASEVPEWRLPVSLTSLISGQLVDPKIALARLAHLTALEGPATTENWVVAEVLATLSLFTAGRHDEAERHARASLSRLEQNVDGTLHELLLLRASAYNILAIIAFQRGNTSEAIRFADQALEIFNSSPTPTPAEQFTWALSAIPTHKLRALLFLRAGHLEAAKAALERHVLTLTESVPNLLPEMQIDLVDSYIIWASVLGSQREFSLAENVLQKAVQVARDCAARNPQDDRCQLEVLRSLEALGRIQLGKQDFDSAMSTLVPAAALADRLEAHGSRSEFWRDVLEEFYIDLGIILARELSYSRPSDRIREQALSSIKRRLERAPDDVWLGWLLASCYLHRAMLLETENITGAKDAARQALDLVAKLPVQNERDADTKSKIEALRAFVRKKPQRPRHTKR